MFNGILIVQERNFNWRRFYWLFGKRQEKQQNENCSFHFSLPEIHKLHGHGQLLGAHGGDDGLQFIPALAVDAHFVTLDLCGDLEFAVANEPGDLFGDGGFDALLDFDALPGVAERRNVRFALLHTFQADAAFGEPADDDFVERGDFEPVLGGEFDLGFLQHDFPLAAFKVEAVGQFLSGLVDGVLDFHRVDLGNNVE